MLQYKKLKQISAIFKEHEIKIFERWLNNFNIKCQLGHYGKCLEKTRIFEEGFKKLLKSFIVCFEVENCQHYFSENKRLAAYIASNDIPFREFIDVFHTFEESYMAILYENLTKDEIIEYFIALDELHHKTIAILVDEYFGIKDATIFALAKLAEKRDPETGFHLERTREYAVALSTALNLNDDFISSIYRVGPLHDIGKISIPDSILLKPGKLNSEEYEMMKKHTIFGAEAINEIIGDYQTNRGYLKMAKDITLSHHEKFDGSGYPFGLNGEEIPLAARIFAIADAYDAIVSKRVYKDPLSHEEAVKRIKLDSGKHFDPKLTEVFINVEKQFYEILKKYDAKNN